MFHCCSLHVLWAFLSTVKRDTEKTCNQISETQELKQLEQPVLRELTLPKWWGTAGAPSIPRSVDRRPPWQVQGQVACRLRLRRAGVQGTHAGGQCAKDRAPARGGKKINLIIAVARAGGGGNKPRRWALIHTKRKKKGHHARATHGATARGLHMYHIDSRGCRLYPIIPSHVSTKQLASTPIIMFRFQRLPSASPPLFVGAARLSFRW